MSLVHSVVPRSRLMQKFDQPSRTKQSFKDECDINKIMKKFERTGMVAHLSKYQGSYADVSGGVDYHTALNTVAAAKEMFLTLPAKVRARFEHDPGAFLDFVGDPANEKEMVEMGLKKAPVAPPAPAPAPDPAPTA